MGRKRSKKTADLPPYCYIRREKIVYRRYLGRENGKTLWGDFITLGKADAPRSHIWEAYEQLSGYDRKFTLQWLLDEYHDSRQFKELAPRTQRDYENYRNRICGCVTKSGKPLGEFKLAGIPRPAIRNYLDKYKDRNGVYAPIAANRHIQYLKAAWNWGMERWSQISMNPCEKVRLNREEPRDRYVTDAEMEAYKALCGSRSYLPLAMELAYLCRLRANEVYSIKVEQIEERGLRVFRGKGSRGEITAWTPRLRSVVNACRDWNSAAPSPLSGSFLLHDKKGCKYTMSNHASQWQRLNTKADKAGVKRFTFHDLKAKGYSDQKEQDAGHKSEKMHRVYDRKGRLVSPADGGDD